MMLSNLWNLFERNHTPKQELNADEQIRIKENGLIYVCKYEDAKKIIHNGVIPGARGNMYPKEKGFSWFYIYDAKTKDDYIKIVQSKGKIRRGNDGYVIIKDLSHEQLKNLRIRRTTKNGKKILDLAVVYPGTLKTANMQAFDTPILYEGLFQAFFRRVQLLIFKK